MGWRQSVRKKPLPISADMSICVCSTSTRAFVRHGLGDALTDLYPHGAAAIGSGVVPPVDAGGAAAVSATARCSVTSQEMGEGTAVTTSLQFFLQMLFRGTRPACAGDGSCLSFFLLTIKAYGQTAHINTVLGLVSKVWRAFLMSICAHFTVLVVGLRGRNDSPATKRADSVMLWVHDKRSARRVKSGVKKQTRVLGTELNCLCR